MALSSQNRLKKDLDFQEVFKSKETARGRWLLVKSTENHRKVSRFGVVISGKVDKRATVRNRLRRVLAVAIEKKLHQLKPGFDVGILVLAGKISYDEEQVVAELGNLFEKLRLIKK